MQLVIRSDEEVLDHGQCHYIIVHGDFPFCPCKQRFCEFCTVRTKCTISKCHEQESFRLESNIWFVVVDATEELLQLRRGKEGKQVIRRRYEMAQECLRL